MHVFTEIKHASPIVKLPQRPKFFLRKGMILSSTIGKHRPMGPYKSLPTPTAGIKSNKPSKMQLSNSAFPPNTPLEVISRGKELFELSVSPLTQNSYNSALSHVFEAEKVLGRKIQSSSEEDMLFLVSFLSAKNLKPSTIQSYMTAFRRLQMARGVHNPPALSPLAKTLLTGLSKVTHNPKVAAQKRARRSISLPLLKIISHAIASQCDWSEYKRSLIWTVCVLAWWGGFRLSELLPRLAFEFSLKNALLMSDVTLAGKSIEVWVRHPKVPSKFGDVVQVWRLESSSLLDPVENFEYFASLRSKQFGPALAIPVFVQEDGRCLTRQEFNRILKRLLELYSCIDPSEVHSFSGHSFRSGLATLLNNMGFSETQIKAWGRWLSRSYLLYTKDKRTKLELQQSLTDVFQQMLIYD